MTSRVLYDCSQGSIALLIVFLWRGDMSFFKEGSFFKFYVSTVILSYR